MLAMARPPCYLASPLGFSEAGRHYYSTVYLPALAEVVEPVDPWSLTSDVEIVAAQTAGKQRELWLELGRRNVAAIRRSKLLAAYLDGQEPDSGTVAELGFAAGLGLPCFGLRTDLREVGEPGMALNLQVETFILESGGSIALTLDELVAALGAAAAGLEG
jgi:nucleoside 2-deoxyribosyltransferase